MLELVRKIFSDANERDVRRLAKTADAIGAWEPTFSALNDQGLRDKTDEFRRRLAAGEGLDALLPEAFAAVREAARRALGLRPFDVQLMGAIALHQGKIAEMGTGEGKTLVAPFAAYLHALAGEGVHIITVNDYLALRDCRAMAPLFRTLGMTAGCNVQGLTTDMKRQAYACDVTYGTNSEFAFDYLRDNMVKYKELVVQRKLRYAIVDEVDSVLIDEARVPLIVSGQSHRSDEMFYAADRFAARLVEGEDFELDRKLRMFTLTEGCVAKAERMFGIDNLFRQEHELLHHHLNQAVRARFLLKRDVDYVVQDNAVVIVDENTGRLMSGRRYGDSLHQAIEAKENVLVQDEHMTVATITYQNFFRLYGKLAGMTGTAKTEEEELKALYGLRVVQIPPNRPSIRKDLPDLVYRTAEGKYRAVVAEIARRHRIGQPVLVGTTSVEISERLSAMLVPLNIPHSVLNAKRHPEEAAIIAKAGRQGAVTVATNMAGRGTDILLGEGVTELGGLHIIGTERHESRRIDNQLRGRAGRQGDPGSSQFFLSMEDSLMVRFGSKQTLAMLVRLGFDDDSPLDSPIVGQAIEGAQKTVEGFGFEARVNVLKYDDVMNLQRERIYRDRRQVLAGEGVHGIAMGMCRSAAARAVAKFCPGDEVPEEWNLAGLANEVRNKLLPGEYFAEDELWGKEKHELVDWLTAGVERLSEERDREIGAAAMRAFERWTILQAVDEKWMIHIDALDQLRQGIHLRAFSGNDPLREFQFEGHEMFFEMVERIEDEVAYRLRHVKVASKADADAMAAG